MCMEVAEALQHVAAGCAGNGLSCKMSPMTASLLEAERNEPAVRSSLVSFK